MTLLLLALWTALPLGGAVPPGAARVERVTYVMGTRMTVGVEARTRAIAAAAAEAAVREVERLEGVLSTWSLDTPLARLATAPEGVAVRPPAELMAWLAEVETWAVRSQRAFDPSVGALLDAWAVREGGRTPSDAELTRALQASGSEAFVVDAVAGTVVRRRPGAWIDSGAWGKGAALRAAGRAAREAGAEALAVDLGGQMLMQGPEPVDVDVAHPEHRDRPVARLRIRDASVATSGTSERGRHVIDPRSGRPAPSWGSVTVVAPDPLVADVVATALYVMGPDEGLDWLRTLDGVGALFLESAEGRLHARWNPAMEAWLVRDGLQAPAFTIDP